MRSSAFSYKALIDRVNKQPVGMYVRTGMSLSQPTYLLSV